MMKRNNEMRIKNKLKGMFNRVALAACFVFAGAVNLFAANVGFVEPYDDWRTAMQISGTHVADSYYEPVSVFTTNSAVEVSFGWTRSDGSSALPPVKFSILDGSGKVLASWTEPGRATGSTAAGSANVWWSGNWKCDIIQFLEPGDYALTVELDPANTLGETASQRGDNSTFFRFAIKDGALTPLDVVTGFAASSVTAVDGNDFAQAPHAALKDYLDGAITVGNAPMMQFGPYVPMNGRVVSSRKKPLDLVFLIDISGSMEGCIRGLLNNIELFVEQLMKGDANNEPIDDLRVKIVGFDYPHAYLDPSRNQYWVSQGYYIGDWFLDKGFSKDIGKIKNDLRNLKCSPWTESGLDALWYVVNEKDVGYVSSSSPFRQKGEAARAVILFTDEAPEITVLSAEGCKDKTIADLVDAVEDAEINLTIVAENFTDSLERYDQLANTNKYASAAKKSVYIRTPNLAKFSQDASSLRNLAGSVLSQVDTIVVEPMLKVETEDYGTLSFKWKNDSTAGTNNVFRFDGYNLGNRANVVTNAVLDSGTGWKEVELNVLEDGLHTFEWTYRKIGYEGDIVDCGLIADLIWEPWATQLKVTPSRMEFECEGGNSEVVTVKCNTNWIASVDASWVHLSASGKGNGTFTYTVDANAAHSSRTATITVKAGDNGRPDDVIVERTVTVFQKESPYVENGEVQILDVGLKSRWPWNGLVDLDFRVVTPAKDVPVTVSIVGWNRESEGYTFDGADYDNACRKRPRNNGKDIFTGSDVTSDDGCRGVEVLADPDDEDFVVFNCPSSGVYRITWDLSEWGLNRYSADGEWTDSVDDVICNDVNEFHTPRFCVILNGKAYDGDKECELTSNEVRVDTRVNGERMCGGLIASETEKIGHPNGSLDPFAWDSFSVADGMLPALSLVPEAYRVEGMDTELCVVNDVHVHGGVISNDTVWAADKVHLVRDNVFVKEGATLTIEDGAVVKLCKETYIFSHYIDSDVGCNLIAKGAYFVDACDAEHGGDTLHGSGDYTHEYGYEEARFYDNSFPSSDSGLFTYSSGMYGVQLYVPELATNEDGVTERRQAHKWTRYYTYGQPLGILPRPTYAGESFGGWFYLTSDINTWLETGWTYSDLVDEGYLVDEFEDTVIDDDMRLDAYSGVIDADDNFWPMGNGADAVIKLAYSATNYTATVHKPEVLSVTVNEAVIPPANYTVAYSGGNFTTVGVYTVSVNFLYDYTNTAYATYAIYPTKAEDATVTFSPAEYMYSGSKFTKPSVRVYAGGRYLNSDEYSIGWSAGDWTTPGTYTATVELKGNYEGTVTKTFEIKEHPDLAVVMYDNDADAGDRVVELRGKGYSPRVLYLSGNDVAGNDGVATRGIIKLLKEDLDVRSFVLTNYVCRYDDYASVGSNRCETSYAPGFAGKALPFMGAVVSDTDRCVAQTNGYMSATELLDFLRLAATIQDAMLPALPAGATDADVVALIGKMSWGDSEVAAKITTVAAYNRFRAWFERLNAATQAAVEASSRAYISSVVSEILADAVLLGDSEKVDLSITDFDLDSSTGSCSVTVELKLGGTAKQLKAAKEAFAGKVRLGATLKGMSPATESDIAAATLSGNRVKLSVKMPSGESGFVTIKID